jgi:hypothetical protein
VCNGPQTTIRLFWFFRPAKTSSLQVRDERYRSLYLDRACNIESFQLQDHVVTSGKSAKAVKQIAKN